MWKHRELGFTVTDVRFEDGYAWFMSNGIETPLPESVFRATYEEVK